MQKEMRLNFGLVPPGSMSAWLVVRGNKKDAAIAVQHPLKEKVMKKCISVFPVTLIILSINYVCPMKKT